MGEAFRKGDMLRVRMQVDQTRRGDRLSTERRILEVLEHIPRPEQLRLDEGALEHRAPRPPRPHPPRQLGAGDQDEDAEDDNDE
jgi:hypothetical protein